MNNIYPQLGAFIMGIFSAMTVNFISDKLFISRNVYADNFSPDGQKNFWNTYFFTPWKLNGIKSSHIYRILLLYPIFIIISWWLMFSSNNYVPFYWGTILLIYFGIVVIMDLEEKVVLFPVAKTGVIIGMIWGINSRGAWVTLLGGIVGYLIMYALYKFGEFYIKGMNKRRGTNIDEVALGFGDVMIGGIIGLILGFPAIIPGLVFGVFIGGVVSGLFLLVALLRRNYQSFVAIPYAPFLISGAILIIFFKNLF